MEKKKSFYSWFQFRLTTLFWISLAVAAALAGYRLGREDELAHQRHGKMYTLAYPVRDLVLGPGKVKADFKSLEDLLVLTTNPDKWDDHGGTGSMTGFDHTNTLVVHQDADTHRRIQVKLAELRWVTWKWRVGKWFKGLR